MRLPSKLAFLLDALKGPLGYAAGTCTVGDGAAVLRRLLGGHSLHDGPYVEAYRRELSRYLGVKHVYTYGAGRMAMYALLKAMNLDEDDEIIMPGYNCIVIPNAIRFAGLKPVYVDISEDDFNIDPDRIEAALTRRTKALVVQHTFGIAGDMDALSDLSRRKGLPLIEDCAHALGGMLDGRQLGTIAYAGFYSTEATKMFSTEKGGILVTTHDDLRSMSGGRPCASYCAA
jgi:perosamine synthetase